MVRLFSTMLCALALLTGACHKAEVEQPEPTGQLEGTWRVGLTDPVTYDLQNNVLVTYNPTTGVTGYTQLKFTSAELEEYDAQTNARFIIPYTRTGDQLNCPPPARSYTIRRLTAKHLDLYLRGEYIQVNSSSFRTDFVIHLERN